MENSMLDAFFICCCFILLLVLPSSLRSQETGDESEFSYGEDSKNGPVKWGRIKPEWRNCSDGKLQSPINVVRDSIEVASHPENLNIDYRSSNATLINRGHDMMLQWAKGGGYIHVNGTHYQLKQLHWHVPSEHAINGKRFDMEMHLVHETLDGHIAVFAIMYRIGHPDSFLSMNRSCENRLWSQKPASRWSIVITDLEKVDFCSRTYKVLDSIPNLHKLDGNLEAVADNKTMEKEIGIVDPKETKIGNMKYYKYIGSLTIPPCTENVVWRIVTKVRSVSTNQMRVIQRAIHDGSKSNARPIQKLNSRIVQLYKHKFNGGI